MNEDMHKQVIYFIVEISDTREGGLVWPSSQFDCLVKPAPLFFCSTSLEFVPSVRCGVDPQAEAMTIR